MRIQLIDLNKELCDQWIEQFKGCKDVIIIWGDIFTVKTDCIVSPANSFGFMTGGLDRLISRKFGWEVQEKIQEKIQRKEFGEILVGQAGVIETDSPEVPFCIVAPTMRVPMDIKNSVNVYLASKAIFSVLHRQPRIKTVSISGLGTGVGRMPSNICARQMKKAYDEVWLGEYNFPRSWYEAQRRHQEMYSEL